MHRCHSFPWGTGKIKFLQIYHFHSDNGAFAKGIRAIIFIFVGHEHYYKPDLCPVYFYKCSGLRRQYLRPGRAREAFQQQCSSVKVAFFFQVKSLAGRAMSGAAPFPYRQRTVFYARAGQLAGSLCACWAPFYNKAKGGHIRCRAGLGYCGRAQSKDFFSVHYLRCYRFEIYVLFPGSL